MSDWRSPQHRARLRLIGSFRLIAAGGAPVVIPSRRARALLAYLAMAPGHMATRERLCGLMWSDRAEPQARASLRQCLVELRHSLGTAGLALIEPSRDQVALDIGAFEFDIDQLGRAMEVGDVDGLIGLIREFGSDDLLEGLDIGGLFGDWADQMRARFHRSLGEQVLRRLTDLEAAGDFVRARALADGYLGRDPLDESVVAVAIRADIAIGNTQSARRRFQDLQASLVREFGARPGAAAQQAFAGIAVSPPAPATAAPPPVTPPRVKASGGGAPLVIVAGFEAARDSELVAPLRDEVLSGLSRFRDLRVVTDSRPVDAVLSGQTADAEDFHVLGASLRTRREGRRLVVQLFRGADRHIIWSSAFALGGLETVRTSDDTIAQIVGAVLPSISSDRLRRPGAPAADGAYERYLAAHGPDVKPTTFAEARAAADAMETMIAANPAFAPPYLALAYLYNTDFAYTRAGSSGPAERERAFRLAKTALAMDRGHVHGYTVTGWCYLRRREFDTARELFEQALALNAFHARRVMEVGWGYLFIGDLDAARALFDRCLLLYPSPADGFYMDLGLLALIRGDHARASRYFDLTADPEIWVAIYSALNAVLGDLPTQEKSAVARGRVRSVWPRESPLTTEAAVAWFADHHPFQSTEVAERLLTAARAVFAGS